MPSTGFEHSSCTWLAVDSMAKMSGGPSPVTVYAMRTPSLVMQ
ncbi:MAG: hypothetical protein WD904_04255 [Dehalococcoidia bacterium]